MLFHVKVEEDENGFFIATVPALPGCVSDGPAEADALSNVKEAITAWMWAEDQKAVEQMDATDRQLLIVV